MKRSVIAKSMWARLLLLLLPLTSLPVVLVPLVWSVQFRLPRSVSVLFVLYAFSLLLPALFAPEPLLAVAGAIIMVVLTLSLIVFGLWLGQEDQPLLNWFIPGIVITFVVAVVFSVLSDGFQPLQERLIHPYYTSVTLGFIGAVALWLGAFQGRLPMVWRSVVLVCGVLLLMFSGSRGSLGAALVGLATGLTVWLWNRHSKSLAIGGMVAFAMALGLLWHLPAFQQPVLNRLSSLDAAGRDVIWQEAIAAIRERPLVGYGTFQFGPRLAPLEQMDHCTWWKSLEDAGQPCPALVQKLNNVWLIGHNAVLQKWGEAGVPGLLGHFMLYAFLLVQAWRTRNVLAVATLSGFFAGDLTDNVTIVPGPFVTAVPWIIGGLVLREAPDDVRVNLPKTNVLAGGLLALGGFPLWLAPRSVEPSAVQLVDVQASSVWRTHEPYPLLSVIQGPIGQYRMQVRVCQVGRTNCHSSVPVNFRITAQGQQAVELLNVNFPSGTPQKVRVEVVVRSGHDAFWRDTQLASMAWEVQVWPNSR